MIEYNHRTHSLSNKPQGNELYWSLLQTFIQSGSNVIQYLSPLFSVLGQSVSHGFIYRRYVQRFKDYSKYVRTNKRSKLKKKH